MNRIFITLTFSFLISNAALSQFDPQFVQDSIEIEKGVPGTTDFEPFFKVIHEEFDEEDGPLRSVIYQYSSPTTLEPFQRQSFQYESGNISLFTLEGWNADIDEWEPIKQESSTYENGRISTFTRLLGQDGSLLNYRRWTYLYNATGQETGKRLDTWNAQSSTWENLSRKTTTYTAEGQIETQLLERYVNNAWQNRRLRSWTWMPGDVQPTRTLSQAWSETDQDWQNLIRKTYEMSANGLWSGSIIEEWDNVTEAWVNDTRETFMLDFSTGVNTNTGETWNGSWEPYIRSRYEYSSGENTALVQQWQESSSEHENFLRYRNRFDGNGLPTERIGMQQWNTDQGAWQNENFTRRITYFYSDTNTAVNEVRGIDKCLIPNPYQSGMTISCNIAPSNAPIYLELINTYGQVVVQERIQSSDIQLSGYFAPGLYLVRIYEKGELHHLERIVIIP